MEDKRSKCDWTEKPLTNRLNNLDVVYTACNLFQHRTAQTNKAELRGLESSSLLVNTSQVTKAHLFHECQSFPWGSGIVATVGGYFNEIQNKRQAFEQGFWEARRMLWKAKSWIMPILLKQWKCPCGCWVGEVTCQKECLSVAKKIICYCIANEGHWRQRDCHLVIISNLS